MNEDENFLARWSRRKHEVSDEERTEKEAPREQGKADDSQPSATAQTSAIDLSKLPALNEITAETDISPFLQKGVPTDLARAALRRAWTSDPAIRDFVGLQENDWVFNKPGPDQGFGPLGPETDVSKLLAQVFGESPTDEQTVASNEDPPAVTHATNQTAAAANTPQEAAAQQNDASHKTSADRPGRSHGGALPRPVSES